ncbi:MAG: GDP-mannose 4,6-dehydratase [Polyangiaceae bacterium]
MSTWLVTGGVGFIGYHVTRALLARGDAVTVLDDYSDAPYPVREKRRNEADLRASPDAARLRLLEGCVTDRSVVERAIEGADGVVHLAGLAGVRPSFKSPARYARVNVEGTATMFEAARAAGIKRFAFASSSSVYGNSTPLPADEDAPAIVPESPYAASKRGAELVASALVRQAPDMICTPLRFFTVYGPRQRPEMAITLFTRAALRGEPLPVFGDGSMRRDFTHVDDIVAGVIAAAERKTPGFRPYNLGSGRPITLNDLLAALERACQTKLTIDRKPLQLGDVEATFASIDRARSELGWSPRVPLEAGLRSVVEWVKLNP